MTDSELTEQKATLRASLAAARAARQTEPDESARLSEQLGQFCLDNHVRVAAAYLPLAAEPDITGFLNWALEHSVELLMPRVSGTNLKWVRFEGKTSAGALGYVEAAGAEAKLERADVIFLPALAVDLAKNRLGKGKGFYDRALADLSLGRRRPKLVAVVFDEEVLLSVPSEQHDQKVDAAITASKLIWF